jgi:hypothetical protein
LVIVSLHCPITSLPALSATLATVGGTLRRKAVLTHGLQYRRSQPPSFPG